MWEPCEIYTSFLRGLWDQQELWNGNQERLESNPSHDPGAGEIA